MKFIVLLILASFSVSAATDPKLYTEKDFIKKVNDEVKKKVDTIKNKSVSELTKELLDKEEKLHLKELELQKESDSLKVSESELAKKYSDFEVRQRSFIGCIKNNEEESKARVGQLVETISNMKPQKAAEILSVQDSEIAVRILQTINPKTASKIFNFMDKEVSAKLQKQYLEMKK